MVTIKGMSLAWENHEEGLDKIRAQTPEDPEKGLDGVGPSTNP